MTQTLCGWEYENTRPRRQLSCHHHHASTPSMFVKLHNLQGVRCHPWWTMVMALHGEQQLGGLTGRVGASPSPQARYQPPTEETWVPFDPENEDEGDEEDDNDVHHHNQSRVSDVEIARAAGDSFLNEDEVCDTSSSHHSLSLSPAH